MPNSRPQLPTFRAVLLWALVAFALAAAIASYATGMRLNFRFDLACDLRDFPNYYFASKAADAGFNPYDMPGILRHFHEIVLWVYPAALLHLFAPLTALDLAPASAIFLMIKIVALGATVVAWQRSFALLRGDALFAAFVCLGLNLTLYRDICDGNVAVFEAAAIAWAIHFLLAGRLGWFFALIALAGIWKIIPLALCGLAIVLYPRRKLAWAGPVVVATLASALLGVWWFLAPQEVVSWLVAGQFTFSTRFNYFEAFKALFWSIPNAANMARWYVRPELYSYVVVFAAVVVPSFLAWKRSLAQESDGVRLWRLFLAMTAFATLMPGAFVYSYVFMLPFIYLPLRHAMSWPKPYWLLALLGFIFAFVPTIPWYFVVGEALAIYQPLFAATAAWLLLLVSRPRFPALSQIPAQSAQTIAWKAFP